MWIVSPCRPVVDWIVHGVPRLQYVRRSNNLNLSHSAWHYESLMTLWRNFVFSFSSVHWGLWESVYAQLFSCSHPVFNRSEVVFFLLWTLQDLTSGCFYWDIHSYENYLLSSMSTFGGKPKKLSLCNHGLQMNEWAPENTSLRSMWISFLLGTMLTHIWL